MTLNKDIKELKKCFRTGAYKATMILCGSVLELALQDRLSFTLSSAKLAYSEITGKRAPSIERWSLNEKLQVSGHLHLLCPNTLELCAVLRDYKNLIDPTISKRVSITSDRIRAKHSLKALRQALENLDSSFESVWQTVQVINIQNIGASLLHNKKNLQNTNRLSNSTPLVFNIAKHSSLKLHFL